MRSRRQLRQSAQLTDTMDRIGLASEGLVHAIRERGERVNKLNKTLSEMEATIADMTQSVQSASNVAREELPQVTEDGRRYTEGFFSFERRLNAFQDQRGSIAPAIERQRREFSKRMNLMLSLLLGVVVLAILIQLFFS